MASHLLKSLEWIDHQQPRMIDLLRTWARINSGSYNVEGLANQAMAIHPLLRELGETVAVQELPLRANAVISDTGQAETKPLGHALTARSPARHGPRVLLAIHFDTVYGADHSFQDVTR